jgi:hypothetical protein
MANQPPTVATTQLKLPLHRALAFKDRLVGAQSQGRRNRIEKSAA